VGHHGAAGQYWPTFESHHEVAWETLVAELGNACAAYLFGKQWGRDGRRLDPAASRRYKTRSPARSNLTARSVDDAPRFGSPPRPPRAHCLSSGESR